MEREQDGHKELFQVHINLDDLLQKIKNNRLDDIVHYLCHSKNDKIILDYTCFKYFAGVETYPIILNVITNNIDNILKNHDTFSVHVNMKSLTMSDIDKHKTFICTLSNNFKERYPNKLNTCNIYHAPSVFAQIYKIISCFIDKETQKKIHLR